MKRLSSSKRVANNVVKGEIEWELRPGGMLVQKRNVGDASSGPMIKIKVSHGSYHHDIAAPAQSTFGDLKRVLAQETGLEPKEQRLLFQGKEKDDEECLHMVGVKDMSKVVLLEDPASKESTRAECNVPTAECMPSAERRLPSTECRVHAECRAPTAEYRVPSVLPSAEYRVQSVRPSLESRVQSSLSSAECRLLSAEYRLLSAECRVVFFWGWSMCFPILWFLGCVLVLFGSTTFMPVFLSVWVHAGLFFLLQH